MTSALFFCAVMVSAMATPNGYYQQEYNYRTSSSSYKNHELQHQNDDEGYYSKAGDLEGRFRPRVNAHSQHSEYVNPKLQHAYRMGTDRSASFGQLNAQNRFQLGEGGYAGSDVATGGYGLGGPQQNYDVSSDLRQVTAGLREEMEREVQRAVFDHYQRAAAYGGAINQAQVETDRRILEEELRRNMTMRLQEALKTQYGNQGVRGAYSYSITNGRLQPTANYNNQELEDLRRQLEGHLLRHLDQQVQTHYHTRVDTQVHTQRNTYRNVNGGGDNYPSALQQRPIIYPQPHPQPIHPHPVAPVPDSITTVATRVQTELNEILNKILEDTQRRYFSENTYHSGVNYESVLAQLQEELRTNITFHFDDQIKRAYGYSNYASKYSMEDIQNLRRQIETNLVTKLNRDFNKQREKFFYSRRMYVTQPIIPSNQGYYPVHNNLNYQRDISEMQRQLQEQMSRQLQSALMQQSYRQAHYTNTGAHFNAQAQYQATLDQLTAELNSNLTRQIELLNAQYQDQVQSEAYGAQMAQMRNQLQHDLQRQLQQGLQQSYSRYSSWSSSSSHSNNANYRPVRGFGANYGGSSDVMGEDCMMGDDPSVYQQHDDDLTQHTEPLDQRQNDDLTQQVEDQDLTEQLENHHLTQQVQTHDDLTQQVEDQDLTEQLEVQDLTQQAQTHDDLTQQVEDQDLTEQLEDHHLTQQVQTHDDLTQRVEDQDLTHQQLQTHGDLTQQAEDRDLTQQVQTHDDLTQQSQEDAEFEALNNWRPQQTQVYRQSSHSRPVVGQSQDLSQLTQTHDDLTEQQQTLDDQRPQQVQLYRRPVVQQTQTEQLPAVEPPYSARTVNHLYSQPPQTSVDQSQQSQVPVGYGGYRRQYLVGQPLSQQVVDTPYQRQTYAQAVANPNQQRAYHVTGYEAQPQYTSTYDWRPQGRTPPGSRVSQTVQYYENLQRQTSPQSQRVSTAPYAQRDDLNQQSYVPRQDLLGQQTENDDFTQQIQGQQRPPFEPISQQSQDLTQQTQDAEDTYAPLQIGNGIRTQEKEHPYYRRYSPTQRPTQVEILNQQGPTNPRIHQQTHDLSQAQDLTQQTQDLTRQDQYLNQQSQDLINQNPDLTQQTQDLGQQFEDLPQQPQQVQDLTSQTQFLAQRNQHQRYVNQQTQNLTQQNQNLRLPNQQTRDVHQDLTQQVQDLTQQTQHLDQHRDLRVPNQHTRDVYEQNQDLAQQNEDLTQQVQDLPQHTEHLDQQHQDLRVPNHQPQDIYQQNQDLTQQTEDLTQQVQDLTQQTEDLDQQHQDLRVSNHQPQDIYQQNQDLTQQTEDLTQQVQDLTQQTDDLNQHQDLRVPNHQTQDVYQQNQGLTQQTEDLSQQSQDLTQQNRDLNQQSQILTQEIDQPIEPQISTNKIFEDQGNRQVSRQTQDLIQQEINQNQEIYAAAPTSIPRAVEQSTDSVDQQRQYDAEAESQRLIDLLKKNRQNQQQNYGPMEYSPRPVYSSIDGYPVQVGTTRQIHQAPTNVQEGARSPYSPQATSGVNQYKQGPGGRSLISAPRQVNHATEVEPENTETTRDIEPLEPQVASEVQQVGDVAAPAEPADPEVTTQKPGWWSRMGQSIKNKLG